MSKTTMTIGARNNAGKYPVTFHINDASSRYGSVSKFLDYPALADAVVLYGTTEQRESFPLRRAADSERSAERAAEQSWVESMGVQ